MTHRFPGYHTGVVFRHGAPGSGLAREGIDLLMALVAFDHPCSALFIDDGASLLWPVAQEHSPIKLPQRALLGLPAYGNCDLFTSQQSAQVELILPTVPLNPAEQSEWIQACRHLVSF